MKFFTPEEDVYILANYLKLPMKTISSNLGRSGTSARQRLHLLGYRVPKEIAQQFRKESRYKKGMTPLNKGRKWTEWMSAEGRKASSKTFFPKHNLPQNTKFDGCITIRTDHKNRNARQYYWIRLAKANWKLLHNHLWQLAHGKPPHGVIIAFKDGDSLNCNLDNLMLMSRKQNMVRNSIHQLPEPIRKATHTIGILNRKINSYEKHTQRP